MGTYVYCILTKIDEKEMSVDNLRVRFKLVIFLSTGSVITA